jgi:small subunit ribosomal protein S17
MPTPANPSSPARKQPKTDAADRYIVTMVGTVESDKRSKSRTVVVRRKTIHPKYGKYVARKTVVQVHDENNESRLGDLVEVKPCRPVSRTKNWVLVRVVERSTRVELVTQDPNAKG